MYRRDVTELLRHEFFLDADARKAPHYRLNGR
jgi:hypothetical protein